MEMSSSMGDMPMGTPTIGGMAMGTATSMLPAATAAMSGSMDMGMGSSKCKISMLWNWNTIDACFIASSWRITSNGVFAGSCIGVVALVCALEFLRRLSREFDRYIVTGSIGGVLVPFMARPLPAATQVKHINHVVSKNGNRVTERSGEGSQSSNDNVDDMQGPSTPIRLNRPTVLQQLVRAVLHMLQFGLAYFIMLLAMYYNGYIIICIILGALIGFFVFSWDIKAYESKDALSVTACCG